MRPVAAGPLGEIRSSGAPLRLVASLCAGAWSRRSCFVATPSQLRCRSAPLLAGTEVAQVSPKLVAGADLLGWPGAKIWIYEKKNLSFGGSIICLIF